MVLPRKTKSIGNRHELNIKKRKTTITNSDNKTKITKPNPIQRKKLTKVFY